MTLRTSNTAFLAVLDPLPRERLGWWVEVYDAHNPATLLAVIRRFEELAFLDARSDVGVGSVTVATNDRIFTDALPNGLSPTKLVGEPSWWKVIDNGVERFRWFYEGRKIPTDDDRPIRVITGRGRAAELEFGIVLPQGWPTQTKAVERAYTARTWAYVWLELLAEAKARGAISEDVQPTFTATTDSKGQPWSDSADYKVPVGVDLLALLNQYREAVGFEWHMHPSGALSAATALGFNRAGTVRFYEGVNVITGEDAEDLSPLRNDVFGQAEDGTIARASDLNSINKYRRREAFITSGTVGDISATNLTVAGTLRLLQDPVQSRTMKVPLEVLDETGEGIGRRAFVDYAVADTIGYGERVSDGSADVKVISMAVKVTAAGEDLEITVQSKREQLIEKLQRLLSRQLGGSFSPSSSGGTITGVIKQVIGGNTALGDLTDVDVTGVVDGQSPVYDAVTETWVAGNPAAATPSLGDLTDVDVTGATAGEALLYDGSGWVPGAAVPKDIRWTVPAGWTSIDEFEADTLDVAYVRVDESGTSGRVDWAQGGGVLAMRHTGTATDAAGRMHGLMRPLVGGSVVTGDAFITAFEMWPEYEKAYTMAGVVLSDGVTWGSGTQVYGMAHNTANSPLQANYVRKHTLWSTEDYVAADPRSTILGALTYQRLVYLGSNVWRLDHSQNGVQWTKSTVTVTKALTPTHVGFFASQWGGTANRGMVQYHFLRRVAGVT